MSTVLEVRDLGFQYQTRGAPALRDVSFSLKRGELLLVLGPSGAGKSTLGLCLNGLIPRQIPGRMTGQVRVLGRDTRDLDTGVLATTVGTVFQDPDSQFCMLDLQDEVAFGLENLCVPRERMASIVDEALEREGLAGLGRERSDRLSGGMKQRLALASVMALEPEILVFDEPTANLDPLGARRFLDRLIALRGRRTIVIVEHRIRRILPAADLLLVLGADGRPLAFGEPRQVIEAQGGMLIEAGVWLPEVTEVAIRAREAGREIAELPLTVEEAVERLELPEAHAARPAAPAGETEPAVSVRGLSHRYPTRGLVLRDVDLRIQPGSFVAVVGPNGSGKTTLLSYLAGIRRASEGTVTVFGRDGSALARRPDPRLVGFVFQNPEHQFLTNTVFDEVAWGLRREELPEVEVSRRVDDELAGLGLGHLRNAHPYRLSGGEKRRLSLGTAMVLKPKLLLLDEPTFGQDHATSEALRLGLRAAIQTGATVVAATHDVRLVGEEADGVVMLIDGAVAYDGPPGPLLSQPDLLEQGGLVMPELAALAEALGAANTELSTFAGIDGWLGDALLNDPVSRLQVVP